MAKTLFKLLLLGTLSAGASGLPGMLGNLSGLRQGEVPDLAVPGGSGESSRELSREMAGLGETMADLKALTRGARVNAASGLSSEERELLKDAAPQLKFRSNELTRRAGLAPGSGRAGGTALPGVAGTVIGRLKNRQAPQFQSFSDFRGGALRFYYRHQAGMAYALWLVPAWCAALSFLLFLLKRYTLSMLLTGLLFAAANFLLWGLSASLVLSAALTSQSLLAALPRELLLSPVVFLLVSAGLLRLADENYPFWNRSVSALLAPIAASLFAAAWPHGLSYAKGLLGSRVS